ncbi:hypothetical protein ACFV5G_23235 [Streptomyces sp. NPDC059766]|uniref:hypothetical protein n=1 Tax=Streptomyces sp. NPDC059766 TaxID=3346940 RepID=UPI00364B1999
MIAARERFAGRQADRQPAGDEGLLVNEIATDVVMGLLSPSAWRGSSRAAQESWLVAHRGFPAQAARIAPEAWLTANGRPQALNALTAPLPHPYGAARR